MRLSGVLLTPIPPWLDSQCPFECHRRYEAFPPQVEAGQRLPVLDGRQGTARLAVVALAAVKELGISKPAD